MTSCRATHEDSKTQYFRTKATPLAFAALALAAAVGCSDSDSTENAASSADPLIHGIVTQDRPEVGILSNGCTATLITPTIVLTAGHCVRTPPTRFDTGTGYPTNIDFYSAYATQTPGPKDLALAHLVKAVPSSIARPAPLATARPAFGSVVTVFGYGCTDRTTLAGIGIKRKYSYPYGSVTKEACYGDSGGPTFTPAGAVYQVNSAFDRGSGADAYFGDVIAYRSWIDGNIRAWAAYDLAPVPPPGAPDALRSGESLAPGQSRTSGDRRFSLVYQNDGNLVLYQGSAALWASHTEGTSPREAILQSDGNFVVYTAAGKAVWSSHTEGHPGGFLRVQSDGNVVVSNSAGQALWSTQTGGR